MLRAVLSKKDKNIGLKKASFSTSANALFDKILIANRGEIACRVMATAKKLGVKTVAVYSEADINSKHVLMADEAYLVGPAPSSESYLNYPKIIEVAKRSNCQAIHPGYGFLSENYLFALELDKAGLTFIGPPPEAMKSMASKSEAKKIMIAAGVPVTPGYHGENQSPELLLEEARKIEYPVMIKAVMGGGGKGMRIVENEGEFLEKLASAKSESMKHFSDDRVILEKYIKRSRHIEVQVFADKYGNAVYLFERDCSLQRRHQKILEEAPASSLSEEERRQLGEKAVAAAKAVSYVGAGTVEFIWDCDTQKFYFMEMNTRLQVEHPVTEMITGQDLVQWQLEVASGKRLPLEQEQIKRQGHAIEARIYAENVSNNFMPDSGRIAFMQIPQNSECVRTETGIRAGDQIGVHYDPMIAKLIVSGENRDRAIKLLQKSLTEFNVVGVRTNIEFIQRILDTNNYKDVSQIDTGFIQKHSDSLFISKVPPQEDISAAILFLLHTQKESSSENFMFSPLLHSSHKVNFSEHDINAEISRLEPNDYKIKTVVASAQGNQTTEGNIRLIDVQNGSVFVFQLNGQIFSNVKVIRNGRKIHVFDKERHTVLSLRTGLSQDSKESLENRTKMITAPMPSKISSVNVKAGQKVTAGMPLIVLEAMKMEHVIKSPRDGVIKNVFYNQNDLVGENGKLIEFE